MKRVTVLAMLGVVGFACKERSADRSKTANPPADQWSRIADQAFSLWAKPKKERNAAEAQRLWRDACDHGNQLGCAGLGLSYISGFGNAAEGVRFLERACSGKVGRACAALATAYESGQGVPRDPAMALNIARDSCQAGEHRSCVLYARALIFGAPGVAADPTKGRQLAESACSAGIAAGCTIAGLAYSNAIGNASEAAKWLERGCNAGDGPGCAALATQYFRGGLAGDTSGVPVSPQRGVELATRACDLDAAIGCSLLAKALANGEGVAQDFDRARTLASKACDDADAAGCSIAAKIATRDGKPDEAARFHERSCRLGNQAACRALAAP